MFILLLFWSWSYGFSLGTTLMINHIAMSCLKQYGSISAYGYFMDICHIFDQKKRAYSCETIEKV